MYGFAGTDEAIHYERNDNDGEKPLSTRHVRTLALAECPLIAVLRWITPAEAEPITAELVEAGFRLIEVPLNSPAPYEYFRHLSERFGSSQALIGAGTVMAPSQVSLVQEAGGNLIVMPHADAKVIRAARDAGLVRVPGVATPTEGFAALDAGAMGLKLFPAETLPPSALKAWRAVFAMDIPPFPTGGIIRGHGRLCRRRRERLRNRRRALCSRAQREGGARPR